MNECGDADGADHGQHPIFRHQRQRTGKSEPQARARAALLERVQIGQHQKRQGHELQQIGIIFETLEIEDRVEREHRHGEEGAAAIDHAQGDQPADHEPAAERRHRQRVGRPVGDRKYPEPEARDPARQRRVLAVAELEFLAPRERLRDVGMDVLRRLQIDQDEGPEHGMGYREAGHQQPSGLRIAGACRKPGRQPPDGQLAARARDGRQKRRACHGPCVARFGPKWNQLGVKMCRKNSALWLPQRGASAISRP